MIVKPLLLLSLITSVISEEQITFSSSTSQAEDSSNSLLNTNDFSNFANSLIQEWGVPGLSIGIIKLGSKSGNEEDVTEFYSYGSAGKSGKVNEDTLFGIASNSKVFTSAGVGILVDEGLLSWSDKITTILPELGFKDFVALKEASLIDILSHQTGLPRHEHSYQIGESHDDFVTRIQYLKPSAEFRQVWQYNNQMFITAAYLIKKLTSTPFTSFIRDNIFIPLNMTSTTFHPITDHSPTLSDSFVTLTNGTVVEIPYGFNFDEEGIEVAAGAGGIVSSSRDMVKWLKFLITQRQAAFSPSPSIFAVEPTFFDTILSSSSLKKISIGHSIQSQVLSYPEQSALMYGLGVTISTYRGVEMIRHGGDVPGFGSQIVWSSEKGIGVVALTNADDSGNSVADVVTYRVMDLLLGLEPVDWNSRYRAKVEARKLETSTFTYSSSKDASPPSLELHHYVGKYSDEGYGSISICPTATSSSSVENSISSVCSELLNKISSSLPASNITLPTTSTGPPLLVSMPGYFSASHILLHHHSGNIYRGTFANLYAPTSTRSQYILAYDEKELDGIEVKFGVDFKGDKAEKVWKVEFKGIWGEGDGVEKEREGKKGGKNGVLKGAEVRFLKEDDIVKMGWE